MTPPGDAGEARERMPTPWQYDGKALRDANGEVITLFTLGAGAFIVAAVNAAALAARPQPPGDAGARWTIEWYEPGGFYEVADGDTPLFHVHPLRSATPGMRQRLIAALAARGPAGDIESDLASLADVVNTGLREVGRDHAQTQGWAYPEIKEAVNHLVYANTELRQRVTALTEERERLRGMFAKVLAWLGQLHERRYEHSGAMNATALVERDWSRTLISEAQRALAAPASGVPPLIGCMDDYCQRSHILAHEASAAPPAKEPEQRA